MKTLPTAFSEDLRYDYPFTRRSRIIDVGGHVGKFAKRMSEKFGCFVTVYEPIGEFSNKARESLRGCEKVSVINAALGNWDREDSYGVQSTMTGQFNPAQHREKVIVLEATKELAKYKEPIDLLKINTEGSEYEILENILDNPDVLLNIRNIQVQFHNLKPEHEAKWKEIQERLLKTHELTFDFPWCWENYRINVFHSYSQAGQDAFVHKMLGDGPGTFLDIGCSHPVEWSNTFAFERMGWGGLLIDNDSNACDLCEKWRTSPIIEGDITQEDCALSLVHWLKHGAEHFGRAVIDYASVDVDAATYIALKYLPFDKVRFKILTVEHDSYRFGSSPRDSIRRLLESHGYIRVCTDVCMNGVPFEDWWVHPELVPVERWGPYVCLGKDFNDIL